MCTHHVPYVIVHFPTVRIDCGSTECNSGDRRNKPRARASLLKPGTMILHQPEIPVPLLVQFPERAVPGAETLVQRFLDQDMAEVDKVLDTNLRGNFRVAQEAARRGTTVEELLKDLGIGCEWFVVHDCPLQESASCVLVRMVRTDEIHRDVRIDEDQEAPDSR